MNWKSARTSAGLCALFLLVYGSCNWLTSLRSGVGSFYFGWERSIPFVPAMIVPYMSIDLFFIAAPFLCRDERERGALANRISAAILICGACFLLMPLRFAFERPAVEGWLGAIFNSFRTLDRPFNQFPSLHIALCIILATLYAGRTRGLVRMTIAVWFILIGVSTVLTYQHHVIDVIGGVVLAAVCFHLAGDQSLRAATTGNARVGMYYAAAGAALMAAAILMGGVWWLLLWPGCSLGLVSAGYFGLGPGIYGKRAGRLPYSAWPALGPVLLGQRLSWVYYACRCERWSRLTDNVWIGRLLTNREARQAIEGGVTAVVDLTGEFPEAGALLKLAYVLLPVLDLTAPTPAQLDAAVAFISQEAVRGIAYIHCKVGFSRTAAVAGAYLMSAGIARSADEAMALLRKARPAIIIRPEAETALRQYAAGKARETQPTCCES